MNVCIIVAFCAVGAAVVVRLCGWPLRYWWPVFGYVSLVCLVQWVALR